MTSEATTITPTDISNVEQRTPAQHIVPAGFWMNAKGDMVHASRIKPAEKLREKFVQNKFKRAEELSALMQEFRVDLVGDFAEFLTEIADVYGKPMRGAQGKGNITLTTFAGDLKIERQIANTISFDERLNLAKTKATACINRWSKGANRNLQAIVADAFDVDTAGNINVGRILGLRRHNIDDPEWQEAMQLIADSMKTVASKTHFRFYRRDEQGRYIPVPLSMSAM